MVGKFVDSKIFIVIRWLGLIPAIVFTFLVSALAASLAVRYMGYWDFPAVGFISASSVVLVTYLVSPRYKLWLVAVTFGVGAVFAWKLLVPSWYPESYGLLAYQKSYVPIIYTILGGGLALMLCTVYHWTQSKANSIRHAQDLQ